MAITNTKLESAAATEIFNTPLLEEHAITTIFFCNTSDTTDTEITIYIPAAGYGPGIDNAVIKSLSLPKNETFVFDAEKLILFNGDSIHAQATEDLIVVATVSSVKTS